MTYFKQCNFVCLSFFWVARNEKKRFPFAWKKQQLLFLPVFRFFFFIFYTKIYCFQLLVKSTANLFFSSSIYTLFVSQWQSNSANGQTSRWVVRTYRFSDDKWWLFLNSTTLFVCPFFELLEMKKNVSLLPEKNNNFFLYLFNVFFLFSKKNKFVFC